MTLRDVATKARVDVGFLSKVERGERLLTVEALHRVAVVLELRELAAMLALYIPPPTGRQP
jgi:transcriptional regulator with XRE-family HTH domain